MTRWSVGLSRLFADKRYARKVSGTSNPTSASDTTAGYRVGDVWVNTTTGNAFYAVSVTAGAAVWRHVPRLLAASASAVAGAADTNENTLATITIPAGAMGLNGLVRVQATITCTNSGNNKTHRLKFGATTLSSSSVTTTTYYMIDATIQNRASASSQQARFNRFDGGSQSQGQPTAAIDTTSAATVTITGQKASAGETIQLESYMAELMLPDIT